MSRQFDDVMDDRAEAARHAAVADALGLDPAYLARFDYKAQDDGNGEMVTGANIYFSGDVPPEIAGRVTGNPGQRWIRVGPL